MARQEVKPTLKFGFQVYRQFVCEEGFQDFCVGPILIANYILISPQFKTYIQMKFTVSLKCT